jgi:hypothetical protein
MCVAAALAVTELTDRAAIRLAGRELARKERERGNPRGERVATWVLHQGELDRASGRLKHLALSAIWRKQVSAEHAQLSTVSRKTMRLDRLAAYHETAGRVAEACWVNRSHTRISRAAFGFWIRQTGAIDSFWQRVLNGRECDGTDKFKGRTVLAYGDGKWPGGRAPHKRILDSAIRVFGRECVMTTKEFNTTKTHHHCGDEQQDVVDQEKNYKKGGHASATERSLKRCNRTSCSSWQDRDVNVRVGQNMGGVRRIRRAHEGGRTTNP